MLIEVISRDRTMRAVSHGIVSALSYSAAVELTFNDRTLYPRIEQLKDNEWRVASVGKGNRIYPIYVHCKRIQSQPKRK